MTINNKIINDILNYIGNENKSDWYVGIATDPEDRLFKGHCVNEQYGRWIYRYAETETDARDTEKYLLASYNFKGADGGGASPKYVYTYKITSYTRES